MTADESIAPQVATDLADLEEQPLGDLADAVKAGNTGAKETLRRVAPADGTQLLVAASFNSAV